MTKMEKRGSLTVEAALFLVFFLAAFLTLINFARLARAEVVIQHAINSTAMQISQYGYLLTKTGIVSAMGETADKAKETKSNISQVAEAAGNLSAAIVNVGSGVTEESVGNLIQTVKDSETAVNITRDYFKNPNGLLTGLAAVGKEGVESYVCSLIFQRMAEGQVEAYFEDITDDVDEYLENMGIVGGMDGLDFRTSKLVVEGGKKDIYVTVKFKVKNQIFPWIDFGEHEMCLNASTRMW